MFSTWVSRFSWVVGSDLEIPSNLLCSFIDTDCTMPEKRERILSRDKNSGPLPLTFDLGP